MANIEIKNILPNCIISAAVKPNIFNAKLVFSQEWDLWLSAGYIDWAVPMNYTRDNKVFEDNLRIMQNSFSSKYINRTNSPLTSSFFAINLSKTSFAVPLKKLSWNLVNSFATQR